MVFPVAFLRVALLIASVALWLGGLRLFLRSELTVRRKIIWSGFLMAVGVGVGLVLPDDAILHRFVLLLLVLPLLAAVDLLVVRSKRTFSFWLRACGFEVCTVFGTALVARHILDQAGIAPFAAFVGAGAQVCW